MKTFLIIFSMCLLNLSAFAAENLGKLDKLDLALTDSNVETIFNPPKTNEVFVPPGFDDMDDAEITFINHSKSSCFLKTFAMQPEIDHANKVVRISNLSMVLKSDFCKYRDISTPSTVRIGELEEGTYRVEFETSKDKYQKLTDFYVHKSSSDQKDDFEYAPIDVNELTAVVDEAKKEVRLRLTGSFPNGCYKVKEVKVLDNRSDKVIEVLPIVETTTDVCTQDIRFFSEMVRIQYDVENPTKKLIHIRSADGVAINRVVELK